MQTPASTRGDPNEAAADTWPWECLDCGTTIYHDGEFCPDCAAACRVGERARRNEDAEGFLDWMRSEPFSGYVLKVTTVAGVEVALTALWLQMLARGRTALDVLTPVLA